MQTIRREEIKAKMDRRDEFVLLETMSGSTYRQAHLSGAIWFSGMNAVPDLLPDKDAFIVVYCSSYN